MPTKLSFLDNYIEQELLKENELERANHVSSGKLSASILGQPVQWQVLKNIGIPSKELEEYAVRKFVRGNHAESWVLKYMKGLVNKQKYVEYRNTVGYADALVDMRDWGMEMDVIPHEIKSVSNANFKWILKDGVKDGHALQACLYALALGSDYFAVDYLATDDYRVETFLLETKDYKKEVDKIIDEYDNQLKLGFVPELVVKESWQSNPKYNPYPEFAELNRYEIEHVLKTKYPDQFNKLQKGQI